MVDGPGGCPIAWFVASSRNESGPAPTAQHHPTGDQEGQGVKRNIASHAGCKGLNRQSLHTVDLVAQRDCRYPTLGGF